jgi:hypothetical protein
MSVIYITTVSTHLVKESLTQKDKDVTVNYFYLSAIPPVYS